MFLEGKFDRRINFYENDNLDFSHHENVEAPIIPLNDNLDYLHVEAPIFSLNDDLDLLPNQDEAPINSYKETQGGNHSLLEFFISSKVNSSISDSDSFNCGFQWDHIDEPTLNEDLQSRTICEDNPVNLLLFNQEPSFLPSD